MADDFKERRHNVDWRESPNQRLTLIVFSYIALMGCVGAFIYVVVFSKLDGPTAGTINLFLGMISQGLLSVIKDASGFNFGSSTGSASKDAMVAKTLDAASTVASTASTVANTAAAAAPSPTPAP